MNNIPIAALKKFKPQAAQIKPNTNMPICSNLHIAFKENEIVEITKNNMSAFVVCKMPSAGKGTFLVDEELLWASVNFATTEYLSITENEGRLTLKTQIKKTYPVQDVKLFPSTPVNTESETELSAEIIDEIITAGKFIIDEEIPSPRSYVFAGLNWICGSNGHISYFVQSSIIAKLVLRKEVINGIASIGACNHSSFDNYDLFTSAQGNLTMGFIKGELLFYNLTTLAILPVDEGTFKINKQLLINFNDEAIASKNASKTLSATLVVDENTLLLNAIEKSADINLSISHEVTGNANGTFKYLPHLMNTLLKSVPGDELIFYKSGSDKYYITDTANTFVSMIMGMV